MAKSLSLIDRLEALEAAALGNVRLNCLKEVDSPELRELLNYALSGDITFGVKQLPDPDKQPLPWHHKWSDKGEGGWWLTLTELLDSLASRELTGNDAKDRILEVLRSCTPTQQKWTERILKQDLRLSIGAKDINKVLPGTIRVFAIPLAKPFKELKSLQGRWVYQPKFDGARVVTRISRSGKVSLLSRSGKEWGPTLDLIRTAVTGLAKELNLSDMTLDGEVVIWKKGRMDFQAMQKMFFAKDGRAPEGQMQYIMFDLASTKEYDNPSHDYERRLYNLNAVVAPHLKGSKTLAVVKSEFLENPAQEYLDAQAVKMVETLGTDGGIIRRLDKPPKNSKSSDITKIKPFEDGEAVIIGKTEGKGHLAGSLGTMVCDLLVNKKQTGKIFEIGTGEGFTKEVRQELWDDPDLVGKINNFKFQRTTNDGIPLLPTWRGIRHPDDL